MTVREIINETTNAFEAAGIPSARLDAEVLLAFALGRDKLEFFKNPEMIINEEQLSSFGKLVIRRMQGEPVAYITGFKNFWTFTLEVNKDVLIPRPDTEIIVEEAIDVAKKYTSNQIKILDIGTGSGAIAIALADELPKTNITATDISEAALKLAQRNAENLGFKERIAFRQGDLFEPVNDTFDIIVCNPPYISTGDYETLSSGVKNYEPAIALLAGKDGTEFYERLIYQAKNYLEKNGWLLMEIGAKQEQGIYKIIGQSGFYESVETRKDYAGWPRVVKARRK
ncbi:MAG: hypothetical protein APR62_02230 [Smithella sp. SDB]|nr:MAG: hypothetical protein APR62_02230 [Smithella sp. SDB]